MPKIRMSLNSAEVAAVACLLPNPTLPSASRPVSSHALWGPQPYQVLSAASLLAQDGPLGSLALFPPI